ncbi:MAG: zinc-dependent metalloprotease [Myxococcales bacterium]|nr:zinc-dependent metalloprotease [Myxococcales bacterium]
MNRKTSLTYRNVVGALVVASIAVLGGCAESVGDIDRTQPNLIHKSVFQGEWFVRQTVIDVPPTSYHSFVGQTGEMDMIRWEIQEDLLIGYRSYEYIPGSDENTTDSGSGVNQQPVADGQGEGRNPDEYKENPIVAYPITSHVDIQRDYNPRTGEQTNVLVENTFDRPWYEREYIRVDWTNPQVTNWQFLRGASDTGYTSSFYAQPSEKGPDALRLERSEKGDVNYLDFTERMFAEPDYGCLLMAYYGDVGDCTGAEIKVRTSFLKVDPERERVYEPAVYDDKRMGEFGFFRTERNTYDRKRGVTWTGKIFLANRHDVWQASYSGFDAEGNPVVIPYKDRQLRPIVYALSPGYPESMLNITAQIGVQWDAVFKNAVSAARGQTIEQLTADLKAQTGNECLFCIDQNTDGHARIGDLRYNFIYWVDNNQEVSPLGYGPSQAHPETGRIVSAEAFMYGAAVDTYSEYALDIVKLLNGDLTEEQARLGDYIQEAVASRRPAVAPKQMARYQGMRLNDPYFERQLLGWDRVSNINEIMGRELPAGRPGYVEKQFEKVRGTSLETMLINDEMIMAQGRGRFQPGDALPADFIEDVSPASWATPDAIDRDNDRRIVAEQNNIWLADFSDPNTLGLAKEMKKKMEAEGWTYDQVYQHLREQIYLGVALHEVGHTLGLRHNFGGSADPLNYFDEYWPLRERTNFILEKQGLTAADALAANCSVITAENETSCGEQVDGKMTEYQYSTIMDYGGRFNSDIHGLGKYDQAAIASGYTNLVEVFADEAVQGMVQGLPDMLRQVASFTSPVNGSLAEIIDYQMYPRYFGTIENMKARKWMPRSDFQPLWDADLTEIKAASEQGRAPVLTAPVRVPYYACYDEYRDSTARCHTWDVGADEFEITQNWVDYYRAYYVFDSFQRDKVSYSPFNTYSRVLGRYFMPIQNMYQNWVYDRITGYDTWVDDRSQHNGFKSGSLREFYATQGMLNGFQLFWEVLATPSYGSYKKEGDEYVLMDYEKRADADLYVPPGVGRRSFSVYDNESGYFLFNRVTESGQYYTQLAALTALINSRSRVGFGQDRSADSLSWALPYYIVFKTDVDNLFGSVIQEDSKYMAPQIVKGELQYHTLDDLGTEPDTGVDGHIKLDIPWTTRIYSMLYGTAALSATYDLSFVQGAQVAIEGSGEVLQPAPGFETVRFQDKASGRVYAAYRPTEADGHRRVAAEIIEQCNDLQAMADAVAAKGDAATEEEKAAAQQAPYDIKSKINDLEILRGMYKLFGTAF